MGTQQLRLATTVVDDSQTLDLACKLYICGFYQSLHLIS